MEDLGLIHQLIVPFFGRNMTFNVEVIVMTPVHDADRVTTASVDVHLTGR